jgi:hypothetical protein
LDGWALLEFEPCSMGSPVRGSRPPDWAFSAAGRRRATCAPAEVRGDLGMQPQRHHERAGRDVDDWIDDAEIDEHRGLAGRSAGVEG